MAQVEPLSQRITRSYVRVAPQLVVGSEGALWPDSPPNQCILQQASSDAYQLVVEDRGGIETTLG